MDSSLHIATPPVFRPTSLFDVDWNPSPPASRDQVFFNTRWDIGKTSIKRRQQPFYIHTRSSGLSRRTTNKLIVPGSNINGKPQLPRVNKTMVNKAQLFDVTTLFHHRDDNRKTGGIVGNYKIKAKRQDEFTVAPKRFSCYEGFSEKTLMLLTAKNASDFARKFHSLSKLDHEGQEATQDSSMKASTVEKLETEIKSGPIWGRDAHYRKSGQFGQTRKKKSRGNSQKRNQKKSRLFSLEKEFNEFMSLSTTHPKCFRQLALQTQSGNVVTVRDSNRSVLAPLHTGRHLKGLKKTISKSVYSRSCGLSLKEIESVTIETTKRRMGKSISMPSFSADSSVPRNAVVVDIPIAKSLEQQIFMELRERHRSRESSRQGSRGSLAQYKEKHTMM